MYACLKHAYALIINNQPMNNVLRKSFVILFIISTMTTAFLSPVSAQAKNDKLVSGYPAYLKKLKL